MTREEAIKVIRKNWPDASFTQLREALETLIPELAESEDEKIRKALIQYLKDYSHILPNGLYSRYDFFTYLEKQKSNPQMRKCLKPTDKDVCLKEIKTVRDLIDALLDYNLDAEVFIGDNLYNEVELSYGGSDGCTPKTCKDVGLHIKAEDQQPESTLTPEHEQSLFGETIVTNMTIVITDPCYLKKSSPLMRTNTIYGDWSCMVYPGKMGENKDPEEWDDKYFKFFNDCNFGNKTEAEKETLGNYWTWFKKCWKEGHTLGEFCADAGEVGVFAWNTLSAEEQDWVRTHDWCAAVIENVSGCLAFKTTVTQDGSRSLHVVCAGDTNFFTMQSGF